MQSPEMTTFWRMEAKEILSAKASLQHTCACKWGLSNSLKRIIKKNKKALSKKSH